MLPKFIKNLVIFLFVLAIIFISFLLQKHVYKNGDSVQIKTLIFSDPVNFSGKQFIKVGTLTTFLPEFPVVHYGDEIILQGRVIDGKLTNPKLLAVKTNSSHLFIFREKLIDFIQKTLPEPEAGLLAGIVLGARGALDNDFYKDTKAVGLTHVIVASGTNVGLFVSFLLTVTCVFMNRRKAIYIVILGIILYLFLSGFDAPLIRASIMAAVLFTSQLNGRIINKWSIYFAAAAIMLIYKPLWITDTGFLMSFAATGSLMLFEPRLAKFLYKLPDFLKESISTSLAAQIGVVPIVILVFGRFNPLGILGNILVIWTIPLIMAIGALGAVVGIVFEPLGTLLLYLTYPLLYWFTFVVKSLS